MVGGWGELYPSFFSICLTLHSPNRRVRGRNTWKEEVDGSRQGRVGHVRGDHLGEIDRDGKGRG